MSCALKSALIFTIRAYNRLVNLFTEENKANIFNEENKKNQSNKLVTYDDLPALLFIQQKYFEGIGVLKKVQKTSQPTQEGFEYILVDEVQDYSPFHIYIIQQFVKSSRMTLLGDLGQGIFSPRGIEDWGTVFKSLMDDNRKDYEYIELSTIYRSTLEIVNYANQILRPYSRGRYKLSSPVGREGSKPKHQKFNSMQDQLTKIISKCKELEKQSFESIAIITKDWEEAYALYSGLKEKIEGIELLNEQSKEIKGGVFVSPVYLTKGFEYDAVIIANASIELYSDSNNSRKLLYVAVTRALHQVHVLYRDKLTLPLMEMVSPSEAKKIKEEIKIESQIKAEIDRELESDKKQIINLVENQFEDIFKRHAQEIYKLKMKIIKLEQEVEYYKKKALSHRSD